MNFDLHFKTLSVVKPLTEAGKKFYAENFGVNVYSFAYDAEVAGLHLSFADQELRAAIMEGK